MLRVMLVDDEPFILQGLKILVDWNKEGFDIVYTASNGKEALEYLKNNEVDLIISDVQMPVMNGLELLENIQNKGISHARFAILTGYDDFSYAQRAIKYNSMDYILKPVQKRDILALLRNVSKLEKVSKEREDDRAKMEDAYLARNVIALIKASTMIQTSNMSKNTCSFPAKSDTLISSLPGKHRKATKTITMRECSSASCIPHAVKCIKTMKTILSLTFPTMSQVMT